MHERNYIHRDIKPDNFLVGKGQNAHVIYLIDYGLSKLYYDDDKSEHIPYKDGKSITGTERYVSLNTQLGIEQSRRDDLESLCYTIIYFLKGSLPWQGLKAKNSSDKSAKVLDMKRDTDINTLCKDLPYQIQIILNYCRGIGFDEEPDYCHIRHLFAIMAENAGFKLDDKEYDWILKKKEKK